MAAGSLTLRLNKLRVSGSGKFRRVRRVWLNLVEDADQTRGIKAASAAALPTMTDRKTSNDAATDIRRGLM
jgi:hypothetical protein